MGIVLVPAPGSYVKNFQIYDTGSVYNGNIFKFYQGKFLSGKLNGVMCTLTNYSDANFVSIRVGPFKNGLENGTVQEYVFPKSQWDSFINETIVSATKYEHVFVNGVWSQTNGSIVVNIQGKHTVNNNGYINYFSFSEV